jgi:predicted lipid-binding transport protein (Tim44 family)
MFNLRKKTIAALVVSLTTLTLIAPLADARSLSGGKSSGRQSTNYSQRQTPPAQTAPQPQRAAPVPTQSPQPAAAAQPQRNRWLGPLAGIAAGLGIASLLSHFGMGAALAESVGSMLLIAVVVMAGLFLWRRMRGNESPLRAAGVNQRQPNFDPHAWQSTAQPQATDATFAEQLAASKNATPTWSIPADFDVDNFLRGAKVFFIRLQAAWDKVDLEDIREFTTAEMFAEIKLQLNERGAEVNVTDVMSVNAELLGIEDTARDQLASVRFTGTLRPAPDAPVEAFDEVWNLTKSSNKTTSWMLAGIQQAH